MSERDLIEIWKLDFWKSRVDKVENYVASRIEGKKTACDMENILFRNYARIVLCIKEILTLLSNGYPDGALSIARTVYEIDILTEFIYNNNSPELIERYFDDHNVKAYKNLRILHEDIYKEQGNDKFKNIAKDFEDKLKDLKKKYGSIKGEYWWASVVFQGKRTNFSQIDNSVNEDYLLRMIYKRACISVHASAIGSYALLGRENEEGNMIYTTQTEKGFEGPLLLAMVSHDRFVQLLCNYWKIDEKELLSDVTDIYQEYIQKSLFE